MDIWEADKLLLFIAFVVPGFISLKTYAVLQTTSTKEAAQQVVDAVAYSCINYAILLWPIYEIEARNIRISCPTTYVAFYVVVLLIAPVVWAILWSWFRKTKAFQKLLPHPTEKPWDYVFGKRLQYWIVVTFKDGKRIGGKYDTQSFASSGSAPEQLYLEEAWEINAAGGFNRKRNTTAGLIVMMGSEVVSVELFTMEPGGTDEHKDASTDNTG
jgi:hypothetical protein